MRHAPAEAAVKPALNGGERVLLDDDDLIGQQREGDALREDAGVSQSNGLGVLPFGVHPFGAVDLDADFGTPAAYNHYAGMAPVRPATEIEVYPFNQHEGGQGFQLDRQLRWMRELTPAS